MDRGTPPRHRTRWAIWLCIGTWCIAFEYVLWPVQEPGSSNGLVWTLLGNVLLVTLLFGLIWGIAVPLWYRLRRRLRSHRHWMVLGALWAVALLFWLGMSSELALTPGGNGGGAGVLFLPLSTPFGFLPSMLFAMPGGFVQGYLSPVLGLFVVVGFLWSGAVLEGFLSRASSWKVPGLRGSARGAQVAGTMSWLPGLGFSMYCCSTPPLLGALLLAGAPTGWLGAYGNLAVVLNGVWMLLSVLAVLASVQLSMRHRGPFPEPPSTARRPYRSVV